MARADSGGFDLVLAISPEYLRDKLDDLLPDRFDPKVSFDWDWDAPGPVNIDAHIGLSAHLTLTIEDVIVQPGPDGPRVQVGTTTGVWFEWDDVTLIEHKVLLGAGRWPKQGALDGSDPDELRLVATLAGNLTSAGHVVQISGLTAHLGFESGSASDIPGVAALLAAVNAPPDWLIPDKLEELVAAIAGWIARLPQSFADRLTDLLPDALPAVAMPIGNVRFTSVGTDVLALASMSGTGGDPHAVVRSPIRRNASGVPTGPLGLVVANALMLRTAREGLGFLPDAGWHAPHPCHWRSMDRLTTVQEIEVYLSWVLVSIDEVGQTGLTRQTFAVSELAWRAIRPDDERIAHAHLVAQQWAAAWRDGNAAAMDALYARDAVVADSLAGVRATSRTDVIALPTSAPGLASLAGVTIPSMPELGGPAVFVLGTTAFDSWTTHPIETIVALGATHSDDGCPGGVAVELQLGQDGRIVHEQRYHRIADLARCSGGSLPRGWWDDIPIPSPIAFEPTGTMELGGTEIAMFNSTAGLDGLVRWAYGRFARARLKPPVVGQVAFHQPSIDLCQGVGGLAAGDQLSLCFTETSACADRSCSSWTPAARSLTLHELGHTWLSAYTDSEAHATFLRASRQPSWADSAQPRAGRGVELAASVLAWGLADQPFGIERAFADRPCQERVALFRTLTGQPPLNDECVAEEPAGEAAPAGG